MERKDKWIYFDKKHSDLYDKFRPQHPHRIFQLIQSKLQQSDEKEGCGDHSNGQRRRALDIGCGTGLSTYPLTDFIDEIIGIDRSSSQIDQALSTHGENGKLKFMKLDLKDALSTWPAGFFDLITVGTSAHWMPFDVLFNTIHQLLKPCGVAIIYSVTPPKFENARADYLNQEFLKKLVYPLYEQFTQEELLTYKEIEETMLRYFPNTERDTSVCKESDMSPEAFKGYMSSLSAYQKFLMTKKPGDEDHLETFYKELKALQVENEEFKTFTFYHFLSAMKQ